MSKLYYTRSIAVASYLSVLGYKPTFQIDTERWTASWYFEDREKMIELATEYQKHFNRLTQDKDKVRGI